MERYFTVIDIESATCAAGFGFAGGVIVVHGSIAVMQCYVAALIDFARLTNADGFPGGDASFAVVDDDWFSR